MLNHSQQEWNVYYKTKKYKAIAQSLISQFSLHEDIFNLRAAQIFENIVNTFKRSETQNTLSQKIPSEFKIYAVKPC